MCVWVQVTLFTNAMMQCGHYTDCSTQLEGHRWPKSWYCLSSLLLLLLSPSPSFSFSASTDFIPLFISPHVLSPCCYTLAAVSYILWGQILWQTQMCMHKANRAYAHKVWLKHSPASNRQWIHCSRWKGLGYLWYLKDICVANCYTQQIPPALLKCLKLLTRAFN